MVDFGLRAELGHSPVNGLESWSEQEATRTITHSALYAFSFIQEQSHKVIIDLVLNDYASPRNTGLSRSYKGSKCHTVYCRD